MYAFINREKKEKERQQDKGRRIIIFDLRYVRLSILNNWSSCLVTTLKYSLLKKITQTRLDFQMRKRTQEIIIVAVYGNKEESFVLFTDNDCE